MGQILGMMLADVLDQTIANPTAGHRWHTLLGLYLAESNIDQLAEVQKHILANVSPHGVVGFFRETFMAAATNDLHYSSKAGVLLKSIVPFDADRLMAFSVIEWWRQLKGSGGLSQMIGALGAACIPDLMARIGQALLPFSPSAKQNLSQLTKVALVMPYVSNTNHPPTALALHQARILSESGLQVAIFSSQELMVQHMSDYLSTKGQVTLTPPQHEELRSHIPDGVNLTLCDERFSLMRRYKDLLQSISAFNPDLVLFVGLNSPLMTPLHAGRPTLGLCIHAVQPMSPVDVWLTSKPSEANRLGRAWGDSIPPAWGFYHPYRVQLKPTGSTAKRSELKLPEGQVVLVTVGGRLQTEISGIWAADMVVFLKKNAFVTWLLIGGDGRKPGALTDAPEGQVRTVANQVDLRSVLRCADIYVNPERLGGGFSIAEAMAEGLAVVALSDSDGGDKLGSAASADRDDFFVKLHLLVNDVDERQKLGKAMQIRFKEKLDLNQSGPSLIAASQLSLEIYRARQP